MMILTGREVKVIDAERVAGISIKAIDGLSFEGHVDTFITNDEDMDAFMSMSAPWAMDRLVVSVSLPSGTSEDIDFGSPTWGCPTFIANAAQSVVIRWPFHSVKEDL